MDYLMVPTSASPMEKQDQDILTHGRQEPATTPGPGTLLDFKPEPSIVIPAAPTRNKITHKPSKIHKNQRSAKIIPSKMKHMGKSSHHRHHRRHRYRRITLKEILNRSWQKIHPCLVYLRKTIFELTQSFMFDFFICSVVAINTILLVMQTFAVIEIRGVMSSVVLCDMFHEADQKHFGDLFKTIFTLFQLFTLDDWSLIYLTCHAAGAWYIIIFLIIYILVEYFLLLNLVIAVLVDNFQMSLLKRQEKKKLKVWTFWGEWQLLYSYFQIMTSIENSQQQFQSQASTTDKILDTFFETSEEDYFPK
ncbi:hypothetical protein E2320_013821 [Naja naja]|nr:hypothetical protein E2320_013821 [Naja naja]